MYIMHLYMYTSTITCDQLTGHTTMTLMLHVFRPRHANLLPNSCLSDLLPPEE